jgi:SNF2 family DNA or RNA helicase
MKSYGTITFNAKDKQWEIRTEPHVVLRLKRIFAQIDGRQHKIVKISDSPVNCREITWFLERYPHEVKQLSYLESQTAIFEERQTVLDQLLAGSTPAERYTMKLPPRDHQETAAAVWHASEGLLLADAVGVGKTAAALYGLHKPGLLPAMIVCPVHLQEQWEEQIERFTHFSVHTLLKGTPYDITAYHAGLFPDIIIGTYHKLHGWALTLSKILRAVVFEEAHHLRHSDSNRYAAAKVLGDTLAFRLGLSATPIFGYGGEIFNLLDVLRPGLLGTKEEFNREWCVKMDNGKYKVANPQALAAYLTETGAMLRRTRKDVGREMPPVTVIPHFVEADPNVLLKLEGNSIELAKTILRNSEDFRGQKMQAGGEFEMRMRQATGIAKAPYAAEFINLLYEESGEKMLIFAWHHAVYDILMEKLAHLKPRMYTGKQTPLQKKEAKEAFIKGDCDALLMSLRAGEGTDGLQEAAHIVVVVELDWAPATFEQNIGRLDRDGQTEPVVVFYLLSNSGSDPVMTEVLGIKKQQLDGIRNPDQDLVESLQITEDHVRKLAQHFLKVKNVPEPQTVELEEELV